MSVCTAISCMDGRIQLPVIAFLKERFNVDHVDMITEIAPNLILGKLTSYNLLQTVNDRLRLSVERHRSVGIAIVGHHDCTGNPAGKKEQTSHTIAAIKRIREQHYSHYRDIPIIGLWVDENWSVSEISIAEKIGVRPTQLT